MGIVSRLQFYPGGLDPQNVAQLAAALADLLSAAQDATQGATQDAAIIAPYDPDDADYPARTRAELAAYLSRGGHLPPGPAALVRTSGSTSGHGTAVILSAEALIASGEATHHTMGGAGQWLLALPSHHIAGLQVIARSVLAGHWPALVRTAGHFSPALSAVTCPWPRPRPTSDPTASGPRPSRRYLSLVPTQLHDVVAFLEAGNPPPEQLANCDAILLGGAAADPALLTRAQAHGIRIVTSYGMTETAGGCIYDGRPLPGVRIRILDPSADNHADTPTSRGRIALAGPMLASAYLKEPSPFITESDGERWFITSDIGEFDGEHLRVIGRADNAITTGGQTVAPEAIESALAQAGISAAAFGQDHPRWGQQVVALIEQASLEQATPVAAHQSLRAQLADIITAQLPAYYVPRRIGVVQKIPRRTLDKIDRRALIVLADSDAVRWANSE